MLLLYILNVRQVDCLVRILSLLYDVFLVGSATLNCQSFLFLTIVPRQTSDRRAQIFSGVPDSSNLGSSTGQFSWPPKKGTCLPIFAVQHDGAKALCKSGAGINSFVAFLYIFVPSERWLDYLHYFEEQR
jgi:hypothetical protein